MNAVIVVAVLGFCMCATHVSFGQTTQPRQEGPEQEQAPPEDSPEPLGNARRMYRGLFGGANTGARRETTLNFNGSVSEVYNREDVDEGEPELAGLYTNFIGDLDYGRYDSRTQIVAAGGANLRYYSQQSEFLAANYHGGAGVQTRVAPQTTIGISETVSYGPAALPVLFADPLPPELGDPPPDSNFAVTNDKLVSALTTASVQHGFSIRSQLIARGSYFYTNYLSEDIPTSDWSTLNLGVFYRHRVTSTRSVRMGYNHRRASYTVPEAPDGRGPQSEEHNLFIGVTFDRAFSDQQRTMVSFEGGPSVFNVTAIDLNPSGDRLRFVFAAAVAHQIGRSWLLAASFDRGSQFNRGYGGPLYVDEFYASASGFLNARTDVSAFVGHTEADSVVGVAGRRFITTTAGTRLRYALSRSWALEGQYFHYSYDFTDSPGVPTLFAVPERFSRHSVRGGVSVFVPISPR